MVGGAAFGAAVWERSQDNAGRHDCVNGADQDHLISRTRNAASASVCHQSGGDGPVTRAIGSSGTGRTLSRFLRITLLTGRRCLPGRELRGRWWRSCHSEWPGPAIVWRGVRATDPVYSTKEYQERIMAGLEHDPAAGIASCKKLGPVRRTHRRTAWVGSRRPPPRRLHDVAARRPAPRCRGANRRGAAVRVGGEPRATCLRPESGRVLCAFTCAGPWRNPSSTFLQRERRKRPSCVSSRSAAPDCTAMTSADAGFRH